MQLSAPYKDEFVLGHLGRLRQLNRIETNVKTLKILRKYFFPSPEKNNFQHQQFVSLAKASKMSTRKYIARHTFSPFFLIAFHVSLRNYFTWKRPEITDSMFRNVGFIKLINHAHFCIKCAKESASNLGFSYWHRHLQSPGVILCTLHGSSLCSVSKENAFEHNPDYWAKRPNDIKPISEKYMHGHQEFIKKYCEITENILLREIPLVDEDIRELIEKHTKTHKPNSSSLICHNTIIEHAKNRFPKGWLSKHFPDLIFEDHKYKPSFQMQLDYRPSNPEHIALALSTLTENPEQALTI